jgi:hypothetical protein
MKLEAKIIKNVTQNLYAKDMERMEVKPAKDVKILPTVIWAFDGEVKTIHGQNGDIIHTPHDAVKEAEKFVINTLGINNMLKFEHGTVASVKEKEEKEEA